MVRPDSYYKQALIELFRLLIIIKLRSQTSRKEGNTKYGTDKKDNRMSKTIMAAT